MTLIATTLSTTLNISSTRFGVASATGITLPNYTTGGGVMYGLCENEMTQVTGVSGSQISVLRGQCGTGGAAHAASTPIFFGAASDFPLFAPHVGAFVAGPPLNFESFSAALAGANTNAAPGTYFHLTGTTIMKTLTPPAGFVEGPISIVFDGSAAGLTWDATGNISVAGTATAAGSMVVFTFDPGSGKFHPSRVA